MDERERDILAQLIASDIAFFMPIDESEVYALAPDNMAPGLISIPGEYTGMDEDQMNHYILTQMERGLYRHIPYRTFVEVEE